MKKFNERLCRFLDNSSTVFHATSELRNKFIADKFIELKEDERWSLKAGNKYFVCRNNSAIIAFVLENDYHMCGFQLAGAHTDFPTLKIKPNSEIQNLNYSQIAVEPYGGGIWNTWFDRELSIAGKIVFINIKNELDFTLIDLKEPLAIIPNIAPHLEKSFDSERSINKQNDLSPIWQIDGKEKLNDILLKKLNKDVKEIIDYELFLYPCEKAKYSGFNEDFIMANALDNLLSCFVIADAICETKKNAIAIFNDHEECGSNSTTGANGTFLTDILQRITENNENFFITKTKSEMISLDNAHAVHPNLPERHERNHRPLLNGGPCIKINANQRYATNSENCAKIKIIAQKNKIPLQFFVARSDLGCGSTIGPITAAKLGISTIDIGIPTLAMHSIRETAGNADAFLTKKLLVAFFNQRI